MRPIDYAVSGLGFCFDVPRVRVRRRHSCATLGPWVDALRRALDDGLEIAFDADPVRKKYGFYVLATEEFWEVDEGEHDHGVDGGIRAFMGVHDRYRRVYRYLALLLATHNMTTPGQAGQYQRWIKTSRESRARDYGVYDPREYDHDELFQRGLQDIPPDATILDVGCNLGHRLHYLHEKGFANLIGIDISSTAEQMMAELHPETYRISRIIIANAVDAMRGLPEHSCDLVVFYGCLNNLRENEIFAELRRICRRFVFIQDNVGSGGPWPRDWGRMIEEQGFLEVGVKRSLRSGQDFTHSMPDPDGIDWKLCEARLFLKYPNRGVARRVFRLAP